MKSYKSGAVSAQLFAKTASNKESGLANLFTPKSSPKPHKKNKESHVKPAEKFVQDENTPRTEAGSAPNRPQPEWSAPFLHETLVKRRPESGKAQTTQSGKKRKLEKKETNENDEFLGKRPRRDRVRDKTNDNRTVFVGNCPLSADRKVLKSLFKDFGEIESIRFRCAPPADPNLPRRAIVITKNFHDQCKNYVAYIVFKEEESAKKALVRNGHLLDGLHLRVDISALSRKHDKKRSIFVGNLPFDITEEDLWKHFDDCGEIKNIRLVRDRQTSLGKGIGYVQFDSKDSVSLALKLNKTQLQGRELRVMVCTNKPEETAVTGKPKHHKKRNSQEKQKKLKPKKPQFGPSNSTTASFHEKLRVKKEKRLNKLKKKKEKAKQPDGMVVAPSPKLKNKFPKRKATGDKIKKKSKKGLGQKGKKGVSKGKGSKGQQFKGKDKKLKKKMK